MDMETQLPFRMEIQLPFRTNAGIRINLGLNPSATIGDVINQLLASDQLPESYTKIEIYQNRNMLSHDTLVASISLQPEESLIIHKARDMTKPVKHGFKLPPRSEIKIPDEDPPGFEEDVAMLMDMGFPEEKCKAALRRAFFNPDRATIYLVNDQIPDKQGPMVNNPFDPYSRPHQAETLSEKQLQDLETIAQSTSVDLATARQFYEACMFNVDDTITCINSNK